MHRAGRLFAFTLVAAGCFAAAPQLALAQPEKTVSTIALNEIPFDGHQAFAYLDQLCRLGPRPSGSPGMAAQQKLICEHFQRLGGQVSLQQFEARHPVDQRSVPMANIIVQWRPERTDRILICAHYDTRPFPDKDKEDSAGVSLGANDGASGVALLMELGKWMPRLQGKYGVDFVFFDGSEFVFNRDANKPADQNVFSRAYSEVTKDWGKHGDPRFLGAEYFARAYADNHPAFKYHQAVLVDRVAGQHLQLYQENNSIGWTDTRPTTQSIWATAAKLHVLEFVPRHGSYTPDDHVNLHEIAKIPTCALVDIDDPYWRTQQDTPAHCSPLALAKVGWVLVEWLGHAQ